jgi:hypothetical protein
MFRFGIAIPAVWVKSYNSNNENKKRKALCPKFLESEVEGS